MSESRDDSDLWWRKACEAAERARAAELRGDDELVARNDDEYMRCLFNYYDAKLPNRTEP